jgi:putative oxidoreductase
MNAVIRFIQAAHRGLDSIGTWLPQLALRALVGWEFFEAGLMKLRGENWFADVAEKFPFPFNVVPPETSWLLATWTEVIGGICIWLGLATRFWAAGLVILSIVAIAGVHWPAEWSTLSELWQGYAIRDRGFGNYKLPLILIAMLLPLFFTGAGRLSLDELIRRRF